MSTEQKGLGSKIKRLFIEEGDEGAAAQGAAEEVARLAQEGAPAADDSPAGNREAAAQAGPAAGSAAGSAAGAGQGPPIEPAKVDFASIYGAAGITVEELEQVSRAEQLLRTLPANLPLETQKQILDGTLKTFGVNPTRIRNSIVRQQRALSAYAGVVRQDAEKRDAEARTRIEALRAEALKLEHAIDERARSRAGIELSCKTQSDTVGRLTEYLPATAAPAESK